MPLSLKQLEDVCLIHQDSHRCRYLAKGEEGKWHCLKKNSKKKEIDIEVSEYLKELKKRGIDLGGQAIPLGDNCSGYPVFQHLEQGYDK